ncbi:MAG TPA: DUF1588 domain-containing protein [bacterium]|nr:DUF1588 domain-containing protein [bacterium]
MGPAPLRRLFGFAAAAVAVAAVPVRAQEHGERAELAELLDRYCAQCHTGWDAEADFDLRPLLAARAPIADDPVAAEGLLARAARRLRARSMPPADEYEQPTAAERARMVALLAAVAPVVPGQRVATLRRLTRRHYRNAVRALFGIDFSGLDLLPEDASAHGFRGIGDVQIVTPLVFEKYLDAAAAVADAVFADAAARRRAFGPEGTALADALPALLRRAYRRPVGDEEIAELAADHASLLRRGIGRRAARHALLRAVLTSPSFLFRAELGMPGAPARLDAHELAVRLSFLLTAAPPDGALRARADDGSLLRRDVLVAEAMRLARRDGGLALAEDFAAQWLGLDEVLAVTPDFRRFPQIWNGALRPSLRREVLQAFAFLVSADRSVLELLDADYLFADKTVAEHYGLPVPEGDGFHRLALEDRRRGGVVTSGAMLMVTSYSLRTSPVKRGQWLLARLLDAPPPPPPPGAGKLPKDDKNAAGLTLRQQLERHRADPGCASCHREMDALGFALEHYDPLGRWRDEVHGRAIDAVGELPDGTRIDGPVALKDALLVRRDDFVRTFAKKLLVCGIGRDLHLRDEPELARIVAATRAADYRFSALLAAVVTSPLFTWRDPDAEVVR